MSLIQKNRQKLHNFVVNGLAIILSAGSLAISQQQPEYNSADAILKLLASILDDSWIKIRSY